MKLFADLTKFGIVIFAVISAVIGYAAGFQVEAKFDVIHFVTMILGIYFLSSGSLALNQVQEWKLDQKMPRTKNRPIASGKLKPAAAGILAVTMLLLGMRLLWQAHPMSFNVGIASVILYNIVYTEYLKPKWIFAAVPGAVPGALPVTIGYAAINPDIFNKESVYLFLIMFLWQMPHFWVLAIKYKDDYAAGGIPTLPVALGLHKTLFQIGLYTFVYVGVALAAPLFVPSSWMFILFCLPFSFKVLQEFYRYYKSEGKERWMAFFMWLNISMLVYLVVPVIDKWNFLFFNSN